MRSRSVLLLILVLASAWAGVPTRASEAVWSNRFGTGGNDTILATARDASGGTVVAGTTGGALASPRSPSPDGFVRRYAADGKVLWTRQIASRTSSLIESVAVRRDGTIDALMLTYVPGRMGSQAARVLEFDPSGRLRRNRAVGPPMSVVPESLPDGTGGVIMIGGTWRKDANGYHERFMQRYDAAGKLRWTIPVPPGDVWRSPVGTRSGFAVAGNRNYGGVVIEFDLNGRARWTQTVPEPIAHAGSDGASIVTAGYNAGRTGGEWIVRSWAADGEPRWARAIRQVDATALSGLAVSNGVVAVGGELRERTSTGSTLTTIVYDATGEASWEKRYPGRDPATIWFMTLWRGSMVFAGSVYPVRNGHVTNEDAFVTAVQVRDCSGTFAPVRDEFGCRREVPAVVAER